METVWNIYEYVTHDDYVTLPNGSRFKRVTRRLMTTYPSLEEALANQVAAGKGVLITEERQEFVRKL